MIGLATTGGIMYFVLPPGTGHSHVLLGLGRHDIGQIHFYFAATAIVLVAIHVALHWNWVCCVVAKAFRNGTVSKKTQNIWGLVILVGISLILIGSMWAASGMIEKIADSEDEGHHQESALNPEGSNTFKLNHDDQKSAASVQKRKMLRKNSQTRSGGGK